MTLQGEHRLTRVKRAHGTWQEEEEEGAEEEEEEAEEDLDEEQDDVFTWYEVDLDQAMAGQDEMAGLEWEGHVADRVWQVGNYP